MGMMQQGGSNMINPFAANSIGMYGDALKAGRANSDVLGSLGNFIEAGATAQEGKYNQKMEMEQQKRLSRAIDPMDQSASWNQLAGPVTSAQQKAFDTTDQSTNPYFSRKYGGILQGGGTDPYDMYMITGEWDKLAKEAKEKAIAANQRNRLLNPDTVSDQTPNNYGYRQPYGYGPGQGFGYFPANYGQWSQPKIKLRGFKNSTWNINGLPYGAQPSAPGSSTEARANFAKQLHDAGVTSYKEKRNWLTGMPTKYKLKFDYYQNPLTGEIHPRDSKNVPKGPGEGTTVGNKLRKMFGPKGKKSSSPSETSYQEVPGEMPTSLAPADKEAWMKENAGRFQPPIPVGDEQFMEHLRTREPAWVKQQLEGYTPDFGSSEINPMTGEYMPPVNFGSFEEQVAPVAPESDTYSPPSSSGRGPLRERLARAFGVNTASGRYMEKHNRKMGGNYQEGGEYDLTNEEIQELIDGGYNIEYI
jgi:hypothetical protein